MNKLRLICLALVFVFAFGFSPKPSQAMVATIDLSQLSVIRDTLQTVNQQMQQLQELTNIQQDVLNAIGDATGIDPNSILFQGLMELACGKFQLPRINFNLPIPQLPYLNLPDNLCDWFGMGSGYQSNLWQRVAGRIENSKEYVEAMGFINTAGQPFTNALQQTGGNAICAMYKMRNDMFPNNPHPCPPNAQNPPGWQAGDPIPLPVEIQLDVRRDRKQALTTSIVFAQSLGINSIATAGNAGAQIKNMIDQSKNSENINQQLATQNAILIKLYEQQAPSDRFAGAMLDMQGKDLMQNTDILMSSAATPAP